MPTALPKIDAPLVQYVASEDPNYFLLVIEANIIYFEVTSTHIMFASITRRDLLPTRTSCAMSGFSDYYFSVRPIGLFAMKSSSNESDLTDVGRFFDCYVIIHHLQLGSPP
ncbi:hypothetical protein F5148DRAFT_1146452 [Russula earlei]|uniref:Uncharacterized protein n=1 Tax=Russula earlei TaxID=71964 RepID=A0ACC0UKG2_9AGAM|nr:hypothetical protein F5148DRAFT_1146452 [Russula earlei]